MTFRLPALRLTPAVALVSFAIVGLAVIAASLLGEVTFPLLVGISGAQAQPAILITAMLVALPVVLVLVSVAMRFREEKRSLAAREDLLTAAQHHARVGYWEYQVAIGCFVLPDIVHETLGDPEHSLQVTVPVLMEMTHPDDRQALGAAIERILLAGTQEQMEYRVTGLDGLEKTFWATGTRLLGRDGRPTKIFALYQDITERKATEAALRESEDHHRHAVDLSPQIPWLEDAQGSNIEVSRRWVDLTGMSPDESLGTGWVRALHPDDRERTLTIWQRSLRSGTPYDTEYRLRLADGQYRWCRSRAAARRNSQGETIRWYGTAEDIHDRKTAELALQQSEAFASGILDHSTDCVKVMGLDGRLVYVNAPGLCVLESDSSADLLGLSWAKLWPEEMQPRVQQAVDDAKTGAVTRFTGLCLTSKGTPKWWDVCVSPIPGPDGRPARLLAISRDITAHKLAQDELQLAHKEAQVVVRRLGEVLESTTDCVFILDRDWRIQFVNERARAMARRPDLRAGQSIWEAFPDEADSIFSQYVRQAVAEQRPLSFEAHYASYDLWLEMHVYPSTEGHSVFYRDVTERRRALQDLQHLAHHDSLTGLPNRQQFREQLEVQLAHATEEHPAALLLLDLDEFKSVNDALGHPAGDQLLQQAAARLRSCVRATDPIARFGGDEFAVLQVDAKGREAVEQFAQRIIDTLSEPYLLDGQEVVVGASMGIKLAVRPGHCSDDLIKKADIALYKAKADKRGGCHFFEPGMDRAAQDEQALRSDLREALVRGEFTLHYQPVVQFATGEVSAFEALLRWQHPRRDLVSPVEFIPLAESTGAIVEIGAWVLREACRQAATWPQPIALSVNLPPRQFRGRGIIDHVQEALRNSGLPAHRLRLEITESLLLQDDVVICQTLDALRALGTRLSIDDFGTGYSSLGYLRRFAVDNIKIDRSFVADLAENPRTTAILRAVMSLGTELGVTITAEGVETGAQMRQLAAMGCREGQGYLFSRPIPADAVDAFLEQSRRANWAQVDQGRQTSGAPSGLQVSRKTLH